MYSHYLEVPLNLVYESMVRGHGDIIKENDKRYRVTCPPQIHDVMKKHGIDEHPSMILEQKNGFWQARCESCGYKGDAVSLIFDCNGLESSKSAEDELIQAYNLHLAPLTLASFAAAKGLPPDFLSSQCVVMEEGRLAFPYYKNATDTTPYYTKLRLLLHSRKGVSGHKFITEPAGLKPIPYGLDTTVDSDDIIYIGEGETDALTIKFADLPAYGFPGANSFNETCRDAIARFKKIVFIKDNDDAGLSLVQKAVKELPDHDIRMINLPIGYKDINELHVRKHYGDPVMTRDWIETATELPCSPVSFLRAVKSGDVNYEDNNCWKVIAPAFTTKLEEEAFLRRMEDVVNLVLNEDNPAAWTKRGDTVSLKPSFKMKGLRKQLEGKLASAKTARFESSVMDVEDGRYVKYTENGVTPVTTFTWKLLHILKDTDSDDIAREVELQCTNGVVARRVIDAETISNPIRFTTLVRSIGQGFNFMGSKAELDSMVEELDSSDEADTIIAPTYLGRLCFKQGSKRKYAGWLFSNVGIDSTGTFVPVVDDQYIVLDGVHYRLPRDVPPITVSTSCPDGSEAEVLRVIKDSMSGSLEGWKSLSWMVASFFSAELLGTDEYGYFPIMLNHGRMDSGKTFLTRLLVGAFGQHSLASGTSASKDTKVGISRHLGRYSCIPCFLDEYNLNGSAAPRVRMMNPVIQAVFNHQGAMKGSRKVGEVVEEDIRANLIMCGESVPDEAALESRMAIATLSGNLLRREMAGEVSAALSGLLPGLYGRWARESMTPEGRERFMNSVSIAKKLARDAGASGRIVDAACIVLAGFFYAFNDVALMEDVDSFVRMIFMQAKETRDENIRLNDAYAFLGWVADSLADGSIISDVDFKTKVASPSGTVEGDNVILLHGNKVYNKYVMHRNELKQYVAPQNSLGRILACEPWCPGASLRTRAFGAQCRCMEFDVSKMPEEYREMITEATSGTAEYREY